MFFNIKKESARYWRDVLQKELISPEEINQLKNLDPSPTKKYLDFLVKIWIKEKPDLTELRNYLEEFSALTERNRVTGIDINTFQSYEDFKSFVDQENEKASATLEELENDYEVVRDDQDLFIAIPYTHAASRYLGLKYFAVRSGRSHGGDDCPWCTTFKTSTHFDSYFYSQGITFYYIKVRNEKMKEKLYKIVNDHDLEHVAMLQYPDGKVEAYDASDSSISQDTLNKFRKVVGL